MINYKDLMIGNWVYESERSKFPMRVVNIGEDYCYLDFDGNQGDVFECKDKDMMPIEVSVELLSKSGFKTLKYNGRHCDTYVLEYNIVINDYFISIDMNSNSDGRDWYCHIDNAAHSTIGGFDFQYLHELQNGIRLITKLDLEIKEL